MLRKMKILFEKKNMEKKVVGDHYRNLKKKEKKKREKGLGPP